MEVKDILTEAWEAVKAADIPKELQEIALSRAIDLAAAGHDRGRVQGNGDGGGRSLDDVTGIVTTDERLSKLCQTFSIEADKLESVYQVHDGELQVVADTNEVGDNTAGQARGVALLLVGARLAGGWDTGNVTDEIVRAEIDRHGVYDQSNYTNHMRRTSSWFNINGSGKNAKYGMKPQGRTALKELVDRLVQ